MVQHDCTFKKRIGWSLLSYYRINSDYCYNMSYYLGKIQILSFKYGIFEDKFTWDFVDEFIEPLFLKNRKPEESSRQWAPPKSQDFLSFQANGGSLQLPEKPLSISPWIVSSLRIYRLVQCKGTGLMAGFNFVF